MSAGLIVPVAKGLSGLWHTAGKHAPTILTVLGISGDITSFILAVRATPKALVLLEQKKKQVARDEDIPLEQVELTPKEVIQTTWKCYIPSVAILLASVGCHIGACHISNERQLAWAALYSATKKASEAYEQAVIEHVGPKENRIIHDKVIERELKENPASSAEVVATGRGPYLCYDTVSGRYFMSDIEELRRAVNDINQNLISQMYISLNEFYQRIGLLPIDLGYDTGFNTDELLEMRYSTMMSDDGRPCLVLQYVTKPKYGYDKFL